MDKREINELLDLNDRIIKANEELIRVNDNARRIIGNLVELLKSKAAANNRSEETDGQDGNRS